MSLVKYITESRIVTQPFPTSTINDILKLDNKELLLVSLLEKLCQTLDQDNALFKNICQYLHEVGLLEDPKLFADRGKQVRQLYSDYLIHLIGQYQHASVDTVPDAQLITKLTVNHSYYAMNFIELEKLGHGGFGEVYKVYNRIDAKKYAVKMVPFLNINDPNNMRAFNEVRCLSELVHENVARYYTSWLELSDKKRTFMSDQESETSVTPSVTPSSTAGEPMIIYPVLHIQMELCMTTLREYLMQRNYARQEAKNGTVEYGLINGILKGMIYIHGRHILHHDLNPNNIFLDEELNPKIGDFGMAVKFKEKAYNLPQFSSGYGVSLYMPLDKQYTTKSDVYSAGLVFFEILSDFKTEMERYKVMTQFKTQRHPVNIPYISIILQMIESEPSLRPEFKYISNDIIRDKQSVFLSNLDKF